MAFSTVLLSFALLSGTFAAPNARRSSEQRTRGSCVGRGRAVRALVEGFGHDTGSAEGRERSETRGHLRRVGRYSFQLAEELGLTNRMRASYWAGYAHDLGKLETPAGLLSKPGALTTEEHGMIERHPGAGGDLLRSVLGPGRAHRPGYSDVSTWLGQAARGHHQDAVGSGGYPARPLGEQVPLAARIVAVADFYDAMTTARAYKAAMPPAETFALMRTSAAAGHLDAALVEAFIARLGRIGPSPAERFMPDPRD